MQNTNHLIAFPRLTKLIIFEYQKRTQDFTSDLSARTTIKNILQDTWRFRDLLPKGKDVSKMSIDDIKIYLTNRRAKQDAKALQKELDSLTIIANAPDFTNATITMEWKKSRMWGSNPNADGEIWAADTYERYNSGSIGGCGYDKGSTAVAYVINQSNSILKALYRMKEKHSTVNNRELFGYGSGSGILPRLEGGVGVNCYPKIFDKIGFVFKTTASGKTFDVYTITKK